MHKVAEGLHTNTNKGQAEVRRRHQKQWETSRSEGEV